MENSQLPIEKNVDSSNPINEPIQIKVSKKMVFISVAFVIVLIIIGIGFFFLKQKTKEKQAHETAGLQVAPNAKKPDDAIAKVGDEYIYQKDLDTELSYFGGTKDKQTKKLLLSKLIKDSIILQAAKKNKLITLNNTVYNEANKDYMKRIADIKVVEKKVNSSMDQISGTMVSVWFYNQIPAKIGLVQGKQEAFKKISALQKRVAAKEITIQDAGHLITIDPSYADLDYGYQNNALVTFSNPKGKQLTVDEGFDKVLWNTKEGEITPVFLGKTLDNKGNVIDAFYIFGKVDKKINIGIIQDFAHWYDAQKNNYEITYY
jgi:prefoldin subunit 5